MFVIITYDVGEKRVSKVKKIIQKYLIWTQNSVFEGEITEGNLQKCLLEIKGVIKEEEDSIYIYRVKIPSNIEKKVIGQEKNPLDIFL